jgi:hypothetical protein
MRNKDQDAIFESYKQVISQNSIIGEEFDEESIKIDGDDVFDDSIEDTDDTPSEPLPKKNVVIKSTEIGVNLGPKLRSIVRHLPELSEDTEILTHLKKAIEQTNSVFDEEDQIKDSPLKVYEKLVELGVLREEEMDSEDFEDKEADLLEPFDDDDYDIDEDPNVSKLGKRSDFAKGMSRDVERSKIEDEIRRMGTDWRGQDDDFESSNW